MPDEADIMDELHGLNGFVPRDIVIFCIDTNPSLIES